MVDEEFINELLHYASEFYNPQKAHEYYLRTRQLKGRHSTKGFSKKQTEAWSYARSQISNKQKNQNSQARTDKDIAIAQLRAKAATLRQDLSEKLKLARASLTEKPDGKAERVRISSELKALVAKYQDDYDRRIASNKTEASSNLDREYKNIKRKVR